MRQKFSQNCEKSDRSVFMTMAVKQAREWADELIRAEARGPSDFGEAMRRVARKIGVSYSTLRGLRYRPPKDVGVSLYLTLHAAYRAECERQARLFDHEIKITAAKAGADAPLVRAAAFVAGADLGGLAAEKPPIAG
jgi:hypothetical protein